MHRRTPHTHALAYLCALTLVYSFPYTPHHIFPLAEALRPVGGRAWVGVARSLWAFVPDGGGVKAPPVCRLTRPRQRRFLACPARRWLVPRLGAHSWLMLGRARDILRSRARRPQRNTDRANGNDPCVDWGMVHVCTCTPACRQFHAHVRKCCRVAWLGSQPHRHGRTGVRPQRCGVGEVTLRRSSAKLPSWRPLPPRTQRELRRVPPRWPGRSCMRSASWLGSWTSGGMRCGAATRGSPRYGGAFSPGRGSGGAASSPGDGGGRGAVSRGCPTGQSHRRRSGLGSCRCCSCILPRPGSPAGSRRGGSQR